MHVLTPKMSARQMKYLSIQYNERWKLHQTSKYVMEYKRYTWVGSKCQSLYSRYHKLRYLIAKLRAKSVLRKNCDTTLLGNTLFRESHLAWIKPALKKSQQIIEKNEIEMILSSTSPFIGVVIANLLNQKMRIPWVVDFRDLWAYNDAKLIYKQEESRIERILLASSTCAIVATEPMKSILRRNYHGPIHTVNNAFSGKVLPELAEIEARPIRIVYTGTVYKNFQDVEPILNCLQRLTEEGLEFNLEVYGYGARVFGEISVLLFGNVPSFLKLYGMKSVDETTVAQESAHLLLVLDWRLDVGNEFTKLIEYLRTGRYILATGTLRTGAVNKILNSTDAGHYFTNEAELYSFLKQVYFSKQIPDFHRNMNSVSKYSMKFQSQAVLSILEGALR